MQVGGLDVEGVEDLEPQVGTLVQDPEQEVLGTDVGMAAFLSLPLRSRNGAAALSVKCRNSRPRERPSSGGSSVLRAAPMSLTAASRAAWQMADTGSWASRTAAASPSGRYTLILGMGL